MWPEQRPGEAFLTIAGSIPIDAPPARLQISVGNPTAWFAGVFRSALISGKGVEVSGEAYDIDDVAPRPEWTGADSAATHRSATLAEIAQPMLKNSINLYGEAILRLNAAQGAFPTNDAALEGLRGRMTAWGLPRIRGRLSTALGYRDATSSRQKRSLRFFSVCTTRQAVAVDDGVSSGGTRRDTGWAHDGYTAEGNVRAKTGTMSNIRALAGYARTRDGENLAFAVFCRQLRRFGHGGDRRD